MYAIVPISQLGGAAKSNTTLNRADENAQLRMISIPYSI